MFRRLFLFFMMIALSGCASHFSKPVERAAPEQEPLRPDILFIAYDYGESMAFKAVLPELKARRINVKVLVFGAAASALKELPEAISLVSLLDPDQQKEYAKSIQGWRYNREEMLPKNLLDRVVNQLKPTLVVTGMASGIQAQITSQMALSGTYAVAFYDNFDIPQSQSFVQPWLAKIFGINEVFLPGDYLVDSFLSLKSLSGSEITVTGQPALQTWQNELRKIDAHQVRKKAGLSSGEPVVIFAAGYDKSSVSALELFLEAARQRSDIAFIIIPHPKMESGLGASLEKAIAGAKNIRTAPKNLTTEELARIASLVVTHRSTVGMKAVCAGLPVMYVADENYDNILTEKHFATRAGSWSEILNALHRVLDKKKFPVGVCEKLGMPSRPIAEFSQRLVDILSHMSRRSPLPVVEQIKLQKTQDRR